MFETLKAPAIRFGGRSWRCSNEAVFILHALRMQNAIGTAIEIIGRPKYVDERE